MSNLTSSTAPAGGKGSAGNVLAAICSFFIPGLGQLVQGRFLKAFWHLVLAGIVWVITLGWGGWILHIWSCYEAAVHKPEGS